MEQRALEEEHRPFGLNRYRRHPRIRIAAPFCCALSPLRSRRWLRKEPINLGVVYDLSLRGARVSTEASIRPGDELTLSLRLPNQVKPADITVATVRWMKDQMFGLAFTRLPESSYGRLKKYVAIVTGGGENSWGNNPSSGSYRTSSPHE